MKCLKIIKRASGSTGRKMFYDSQPSTLLFSLQPSLQSILFNHSEHIGQCLFALSAFKDYGDLAQLEQFGSRPRCWCESQLCQVFVPFARWRGTRLAPLKCMECNSRCRVQEMQPRLPASLQGSWQLAWSSLQSGQEAKKFKGEAYAFFSVIRLITNKTAIFPML